MLIPSTYALVALIILVIAFSSSTKELRKIIANVTWSSVSHRTLRLLRNFVFLSIAFLWVLLLITTTFYVLHLPLPVICEAVRDQKYFTTYLDKPSPVWRNHTWLDYKLEKYLPRHEQVLKMRSVLNKCFQQKSVYQSFDMNKYWNVTRSLEGSNIRSQTDDFKKTFVKHFSDIEMPNAALMQLTQQLMHFKERMKWKLSHNFSLISLQKFQNMDFNNENTKIIYNLTIPVTSNYMNNIFQNLQKNIDDLKLYNIPYVLSSFTEAIRFERHMDNVLEKLNNIKATAGKLPAVMKEANQTLIPHFFNITSMHINNIWNAVELSIAGRLEANNGQCYILPLIYNTTVWSICEYGYPIIMGVWVSMGLISISMGFCILFSCRLSAYIRGANSYYSAWRESVETRKNKGPPYGTLVFDAAGNIGQTVVIEKYKVSDSTTRAENLHERQMIVLEKSQKSDSTLPRVENLPGQAADSTTRAENLHEQQRVFLEKSQEYDSTLTRSGNVFGQAVEKKTKETDSTLTITADT